MSTFLSWPEDDQDAAIAYQRAKAEACPQCGTWPDEWEHEDAYEASVVHCRGCELLGQQASNQGEREQQQPGSTLGDHVVLRR